MGIAVPSQLRKAKQPTNHENHCHRRSLRSRSSGSMELDHRRCPNPRQPRTRPQPTLKLMPTTAMADMVDMVLAAMAVTAMEVLATATADMARGLLTLRPMPTTVMADMVDTVLVPMEATAVTAMAVLATATAATARGLLTLRLMPTTATAVLVMVLDMVVMPATAAMAMAAMAMAATAMASKFKS